MYKLRLGLVLLLLPVLTQAAWVLNQSEEGHWLSCNGSAHHRFIVSQDNKVLRFVILLNKKTVGKYVPNSALFRVDNNQPAAVALQVLKQRSTEVALQLSLDETLQDRFISQLVSGTTLMVNIGGEEDIRFSLKGFANSFSNLLIASDIGMLDQQWLQNKKKLRALSCYEISELTVQGLQARQQGHDANDTLLMLSERSSDSVSEALPDVVNWVYSIPETDLPKVPMTKKYSTFKACMK